MFSTYKELIDYAKSQKRIKETKSKIYLEQHHIIPKHMGGTDDESNLVLLTVAEHVQAHYLLALENPEYFYKNIQSAWWIIRKRSKFSEEKVKYLEKLLNDPNCEEKCQELKRRKYRYKYMKKKHTK